MAETFEEALGFFKAVPATNRVRVPTQESIDATLRDISNQRAIDAVVQNARHIGAPKEPDPLNFGESVLVGIAQPIASTVNALAVRSMAGSGDEQALQQLGKRPGVPFDTESGGGFMTRYLQQLPFKQAEQEYFLRQMPGVRDVRWNALGEPVLTVRDKETGEERDIVADPLGIDPGDFAFVAGAIPEMLAGGLAARGMQISRHGLGILNKAARALFGSQKAVPSSLRMAVGAEGAGLLEDVAARSASPFPVNAGELATERGTMAAVDFIMGAGMGAGLNAGSRVVSPFSKRGPLQIDAEAARETLKRFGVDYDLTPAEATGSGFLARGEAFATQKPGSSIALEGMHAEQREALQKAQRILLGTDPSLVPSAEIVGQEALDKIKATIAPLDWVINRETQDLLNAATKDIKQSLAATTRVPSPIARPAVGANLFERAVQKWNDFRAERNALYSKVTEHPAIAGQGRNIDASDLANDAKGILAKVAAFEKEVDAPTGLADEFGRPITREVTQTQRLTAFTDSNVRARLEQLAEADGGRMAYSDLIRLRRDIDDDLFRGSLIKGIPEKDLQALREAVTKRIETGLQGLDKTGQLLTNWRTATETTAKGMAQFKDLEIVDIFKGPEQRGALTLNKIVSRAMNNPDMWSAYRDFFGPASDQMALLRRIKADDIVGRIDGSESVDASGFLRRLNQLQDKQPEIAQDVFGNSLSKLKGLALAAEQAGKRQVSVDELVDHLDRDTLTAAKLESLMSAQQQKADAFKNSILAKLSKGISGPEAIAPHRFVDEVIFNPNASASEVQGIVSRLSDEPELLEAIRQRALMKIFADATEGPAGKEMITSAGLSRFLDDADLMGRLEPVLGSHTVNRIKDIDLLNAVRDVRAPAELKERAFRAAGGISAGQTYANLEAALTDPDSAFGAMSKIARSWLLASIYAKAPVRKLITNNAFGPNGTVADRAALVNVGISLTPVLQDMLSSFGPAGGPLAAHEIKQALDEQIRRERSQSQSTNFFQQFETTPTNQ